MGVGSSDRFSAVRWGIAGNIVWAWILTIPLSALVAAVGWVVLNAVLGRPATIGLTMRVRALLLRLEDFRLLPLFVVVSMAAGIAIGNVLPISDFALTPPIDAHQGDRRRHLRAHASPTRSAWASRSACSR